MAGKDAPAEAKSDWWSIVKSKGHSAFNKAMPHENDSKNAFAVDSRDIQLHMLYSRVMTNATEEAYKDLNNEIDSRMKTDKMMEKLFPVYFDDMKSDKTPNPTDFDCYRELIYSYQDMCSQFNDYSMKYLKLFAAECEAIKAYPEAISATKERISTVCSSEEFQN